MDEITSEKGEVTTGRGVSLGTNSSVTPGTRSQRDWEAHIRQRGTSKKMRFTTDDCVDTPGVEGAASYQ